MTTYRWSFLEDVAGYRASQIESLGVWRRKLCDFGDERGIELLRESGLSVSSLSHAGGFTGSEGGTLHEAIDDALDAIRVAGEIQASCLVVVSGGRGGHTRRHVKRVLCHTLRELGDAAAEQHVQIALQPMHRAHADDCTYLTSLDRMLDLLHECGHPQVGMVFDTYQLSQEAAALAGRVHEALPFVKLVALNDACEPAPAESSRCIPGTGALPLAELIRTFESQGYRGAYETQITSDRCWHADDYSVLLDSCRDAFQALSPIPAPCHTNS